MDSACKINTKEAYNRFMEVWPTFDWQAKKQIKELRYPPHVRKLVSNIGWMLWAPSPCALLAPCSPASSRAATEDRARRGRAVVRRLGIKLQCDRGPISTMVKDDEFFR